MILFDPKYKLDSDGQNGSGTPLKVDIDKMHTYRDAIRDDRGRHVVHSAHVLYPGQTTLYGDIGALGANPQETHLLQTKIRTCLLQLDPKG